MRSFRNCFRSKAKPVTSAVRVRSSALTAAAFTPGSSWTIISLRSGPKVSSESVERPITCATERTPGTARSVRAVAAPTRADSSSPTPGAPVMCMTKFVSWNSGRNSRRRSGVSASAAARAARLPTITGAGRASAAPSARS